MARCPARLPGPAARASLSWRACGDPRSVGERFHRTANQRDLNLLRGGEREPPGATASVLRATGSGEGTVMESMPKGLLDAGHGFIAMNTARHTTGSAVVELGFHPEADHQNQGPDERQGQAGRERHRRHASQPAPDGRRRSPPRSRGAQRGAPGDGRRLRRVDGEQPRRVGHRGMRFKRRPPRRPQGRPSYRRSPRTQRRRVPPRAAWPPRRTRRDTPR